MQLGILGLPKVGKTTLFNTLTGSELDTDKFSASTKTHVAVAKVPDPRLAQLRDLYNPKRYVPSTIEYVDIPGVEKGKSDASVNLNELRNVDALVHVVRAFEDEELLHSEDTLDPARDVESLDMELVLTDLELVERRLERLARSTKGGAKPEEKKEQELLANHIKPMLESETPLRAIELNPDDEKLLRGFQFLSAKPMLIVINVGEDQVGEATGETFGVADTEHTKAMVVSAAVEDEISRLSEEEQKEFLSDLGLTEPSLDRVLRASQELLGLMSFFTVGEDEVRAWTIRKGTVARDAAGAIHSDISRGFIRAEIVEWQDLLEHRTMAKCRDAALLRLEGKEYIVKDGDVAHFRFNV